MAVICLAQIKTSLSCSAVIMPLESEAMLSAGQISMCVKVHSYSAVTHLTLLLLDRPPDLGHNLNVTCLKSSNCRIAGRYTAACGDLVCGVASQLHLSAGQALVCKHPSCAVCHRVLYLSTSRDKMTSLPNVVWQHCHLSVTARTTPW